MDVVWFNNAVLLAVYVVLFIVFHYFSEGTNFLTWSSQFGCSIMFLRGEPSFVFRVIFFFTQGTYNVGAFQTLLWP